MSSHDEEQRAAQKRAEMLALAITTRTELERSGQEMPAEQLEFEKRLGIVRREDWLPEAFVNKIKDPTELSKQKYDLASHKCGKLLVAMDKQMSTLDAFRSAGASDEACLDELYKQQDRLEKKNKKSKQSIQECAECGEQTNRRCQKCKQIFYCGRECQLRHWKMHKKDCKALEASRSVIDKT